VEDIGAHGKNLPSAKEGRTGAAGGSRQGPSCPCLLVISEATGQS